MSIGVKSGRAEGRRTIAAIAVAVLLSAQLLAGAHFHQARATSQLAAGGADLVCALCLLRVHTKAASPGGALLFIPELVRIAAGVVLRAGSLAPRLLRLSGRSPPASL